MGTHLFFSSHTYPLVMLHSIMTRLVQQLLERELLLLKPRSSGNLLIDDLLNKMPHAQFGSHFGSWLSKELINHPSVEELFATDEELTDMLRFLG